MTWKLFCQYSQYFSPYQITLEDNNYVLMLQTYKYAQINSHQYYLSLDRYFTQD